MDQLPLELFGKIFSYLPQKDIENASKVSKKWRNIIINSSPIMNRLCLYLPFKKDQGFHSLPYRDCFIEITYSYRFILSPTLLEVFPFLTHLAIVETSVNVKDFKDSLHIYMPHLTTLRLENSSHEFLLILREHKVETFIYTNIWQEEERDQIEEVLNEFYKTCSRLKYLELEGGLPKFDMSQFNFKLESLKVDEEACHEFIKSPFFLNFMKAQKDTLKEMILMMMKIDPQALNFIYFEMNLEKFFDQHLNRFHLDGKFNNTLKFLSITNRMISQRDVSMMDHTINRCRALEVLHLQISSTRPKQILHMLRKVLPRLKFVMLKVKNMAEFKKVVKWIRINNYHASLILKAKLNAIYFYHARFIISVSPLNPDSLKQFGKLKAFNNFVQVTRDGKYSAKVRYLSVQKQERRSKKVPQLRMFIEHIVFTPSIWYSGYEDFNYFNFWEPYHEVLERNDPDA